MWIISVVVLSSCKKYVTIGPPVSTITTEQVFADSADADAGILGIYGNFSQGPTLGCGFQAIFSGMSADELLPFTSDDQEAQQFSKNIINKGNTTIINIWSSAYSELYQANAAIEGLRASKNISDQVKSHFESEARFIRAFIYFYLVNLFGDVPFTTTSNYKINALLPKTAKAQIYDSIISDLTYCKSNLPKGYGSSDERVRVNSACATALLARVYLYQGNWQKAKESSDEVIGDNEYMLNTDLNLVFTPNNPEAILQWEDNTQRGSYNLNYEGLTFNVYNPDVPPNYYLTKWLLNDFEPGDQRISSWVNNATYAGVTYYYPYKYKLGIAQQQYGVPATEYYVVLRLAEQYLIRAEAKAQQNDLSGALQDINTIRQRAGLPGSTASSQTEILAAIMHERRIEFFAEWGHRWFDLKRTGMVDSVISTIKNTWKPYQALYPIPSTDVQNNPNLTQNPGYF
jgi:hypothetical protein